jgi:predicted RNase H-like HicB family nuclease
MDKKILTKAKEYSKRGYSITIQLDHTSDGENLFFAHCEELEGCMAQGKTMEEAYQNMIVAIEDFIYYLLEDEMPIPEPSQHQTMGVQGSICREINVFEANTGFKTERAHNFEQFVVRDEQRELTSNFVKAYET